MKLQLTRDRVRLQNQIECSAGAEKVHFHPNDKDEVGNGSGSVFPTDPPPVISGSMVARQDRRPRDLDWFIRHGYGLRSPLRDGDRVHVPDCSVSNDSEVLDIGDVVTGIRWGGGT